ncbi:MAG: PAS domain S-box protein [Anaerolineales bacterium]|nr:PAS domain S-box protein [Anaerolineales bacterium]
MQRFAALSPALQERIHHKRKKQQERNRALAGERMCREAIYYIPIPIGIADRTGRALEYNAKFTELYGYTLADVPTLEVWASKAYPDPEYRRQVMALWEKDVESSFPKGEATPPRAYRIVCKDGSQREVEIITRLIGDLFITSFLDVTERNQIEAELRRSLERNRAILAAQPDLLFVIDSDLIFRDCIASDPSRLLQPPEKVIGVPAVEILPPYLFDLTREKVQTTLRTGQMQIYDYTLEWGGKITFYESRMTPLNSNSVLVLVRDVTEPRRTEQALRESERRFRVLFENAGVGVAHGDTITRRFLRVNQKYCDILGYSREELENLDFASITYPEDLQKNLDLLEKLKRGEISEFTMEKRYIRKDGSLVWVLLTVSPLWNPGEPPSTHITVVHDITEQKRAEYALRYSEAQLRRLNADLEQRVAERTAQLQLANSELEAFAYSVSHDLRAPLRAIDGFSRILLQDYASEFSPPARELLERVRAANHNMSQLVDALLGLSRMSRAAMYREPVDLAELARAVMITLQESAPDRHVQFQSVEHAVVQGDPRLLRVVMENLLSNAWKFTARTTQAHIEFGLKTIGSETVYFVRDNGAGFNPRYADKLFGPFQRLHRADEFEGTGIGLATVQRIIRRHGGRIWAEGQPGQGATFYFTLP